METIKIYSNEDYGIEAIVLKNAKGSFNVVIKDESGEILPYSICPTEDMAHAHAKKLVA